MEAILSVFSSFEFKFGVNELLFFGSFLVLTLTILATLRFGRIYLFALIAVLSVLMNIFVIKPFEIFGIATYGGNVMYGCIFFATDILAEHFGKKEALKAVRIGFFSLFIYFFFSLVFVNIQPNLAADGALEIQSAFETIFSPALWIVVCSLSAFLLSNTFDVYFYDFIHKKTGEKHLWFRNNLSTIVSQFLDTTIFSLLAASFGIFAWEFVWEVIVFAYVFKVFVAVLDTPFLYLSRVIIKKT